MGDTRGVLKSQIEKGVYPSARFEGVCFISVDDRIEIRKAFMDRLILQVGEIKNLSTGVTYHSVEVDSRSRYERVSITARCDEIVCQSAADDTVKGLLLTFRVVAVE